MSHRLLMAVLGSLLMLPLGANVTSASTSLSITVHCYSNPETTKIVNTGTTSFKIKTVGSIYQPYSNEPFWVGKTVSPGQSIAYQTGYAAAKNVLTRRYIYNNTSSKESARVVTSVTAYTKRC